MKRALKVVPGGPSTTVTALETAGAPDYLIAVFELLLLEKPSVARFRKLSPASWQAACEWCDARQLTFMLPALLGEALPSAIGDRIAGCRARYLQRFTRLKTELFEITDALDQASIEFVLLKGLTHSPTLTPDPVWRAQGDIDLWFRPEDVFRAHEVLQRLNYVSLLPSKARHLAPMARPSNWKWRGDLHDPEMPISVELHFELWSEKTDHIPIPGLDKFWERRRRRDFDGHSINVLSEEDLLGFAALHLLLHLLHGEFPAQRAWEIGNFLHRTRNDGRFWKLWRESHSPELRTLEALVFQLVHTWFGCHLDRFVRVEAQSLPAGAFRWLNEFSLSPLKQAFRPNKDELWLHLALIPSFYRKLQVLIRRLFPLALPVFIDQFDDNTTAPLFRRLVRQRIRIANRLVHHVTSFAPGLFAGLRRRTRLFNGS